ncbi:MAG: hypothetical protein GC160_20250 [Acidobacteria bacterium]|nr:hypothetical protein [Acidobacteriota bacterium]
MQQVRAARELRLSGDAAAAERLLEGVITAPVTTAAARLEAYLELGKTHDCLGRRRSAQQCYRRILALTDDYRWREQARILYRKGYRGE